MHKILKILGGKSTYQNSEVGGLVAKKKITFTWWAGEGIDCWTNVAEFE